MVSVIIPTYNRADTIKRSIESVLTQSYQNFEIIIIDDGSTDDTYQIIEKIGDSRIYYIRNDRRAGANAARNIGIQKARGEFIAFQDSDDVWREDKLQKQMDMFMEEDVDIVYSRYLYHYANGMKTLVPSKSYTNELLQEKIMFTLAQDNVIGTPTMIVRKKCFNKYGMFDLAVKRFQDWEINIKFVQHYKYGFIDEALVDAYMSLNSITETVKSAWNSVSFIVKKHQSFFKTQGTLNKHLSYLIDQTVEEKESEKLLECLGKELFFQAIYASAKEKKKLQKNYNFVKEWILKEKNSNLVNSFLAGYPDSSIALYGLGDIGKLFVNTVSDDNEKKIKYVIDRNMRALTKYRVLSLEKLEIEDLEGIKCIIITAIAHEAEIRRELVKVTSVPVISVYDVITDEADMNNILTKEF